MKSFWQHHQAQAYAPLQGSHRTDIAIVGAGYTGSWLAYWLRGSGLKVTVLEAQQPGFGASGRNGGLLLQGPALLLGEAAQHMGRAQAIDLWRLTKESFQWVKELDRHYEIDLHITGSLYVGGDPSERAAIESTAELYAEEGTAVRIVPHAEQPRSIQRLGYDSGFWVPDDAMIHPVKLIDALLTEARSSGIAVYGGSPVTEYDGRTLSGDGFNLEAECVLVCTNAYVPAWLPDLAPHIAPVRGQVLATSPLAPLDHQFPVYADHGFNYWHQRRDGRMVVGGFRHLDLTGECGTDLVLHPAIQDRLTQLAEDLAGGPVEVLHRWAGIMAMAKDHLPYVGMVNKRLGIALGYSGHGSTVTPAAAKMLSEAVLHNTPVFPALSAARLGLGSRED